jgi:hypothetical protein
VPFLLQGAWMVRSDATGRTWDGTKSGAQTDMGGLPVLIQSGRHVAGLPSPSPQVAFWAGWNDQTSVSDAGWTSEHLMYLQGWSSLHSNGWFGLRTVTAVSMNCCKLCCERRGLLFLRVLHFFYVSSVLITPCTTMEKKQ